MSVSRLAALAASVALALPAATLALPAAWFARHQVLMPANNSAGGSQR